VPVACATSIACIRHRQANGLVRIDASLTLIMVFRHAKIALPPRVKPIAPPPVTPPSKPRHKKGAAARGVVPRPPEFRQKRHRRNNVFNSV
jgi:hypothetical protein